MSNDRPGYHLEYVNKQKKRRLWGILSPVEEEAEMEPERIQECLGGIENAVTQELEKHGISKENISYNGLNSRERIVKAELEDVQIEVTASVEDTKKGSWEDNYQSPGPALGSNAKSAVARHTGERVENGKITANYSFESDSDAYDTLYSDIAERLKQLPEELNLSRGQFFGHLPRGKSVMS